MAYTSIDEDSTNYYSLTFNRSYAAGYVEIYMSGYIKKAWRAFSTPVYLGPIISPTIGTFPSTANTPSMHPTLIPPCALMEKAVESPNLSALNEIFTQQASPTENISKDAA
eukprot:1783662-Ditylum_brightwellii.AAC.1